MTWHLTKERVKPSVLSVHSFLQNMEAVLPEITKAWVVKEKGEWILYLMTTAENWSRLDVYRRLQAVPHSPFRLDQITVVGAPWSFPKATMVFEKAS